MNIIPVIFSRGLEQWRTGRKRNAKFSRDFISFLFKSGNVQIPLKGWRMIKSETRRDAEILVKKTSPRLLSKKFRDSNKGKNKTCKDETLRLKISRSCQNFPRPTFFGEPFAIPL